MEKNRKKSRGRPPGSTLDKRSVQRHILKRIVVSGTEANCWKNILTESAYRKWKAVHKEYWEERVERAIKQHYNHEALADPALKALIIQSLIDKIKADNLTISEIIKVLQMLPDVEL